MIRKVMLALLLCVCLLGCSKNSASTTTTDSPMISTTPSAVETPVTQTSQQEVVDPYNELAPFDFSSEAGSEGWTLVSQIGGTTKAVCHAGDFVFVGSGMSVVALNASEIQNIHIAGTSRMLPGNIQNITYDGAGHLFVSCGDGGVVVMSVIIPAEPKIIGYLDTRGFTENVTLSGDYALIADGPCGIQIADVSDVTKPVWIGEAFPLAYVHDIAVLENRAYAAAGGSGILVTDISDPTTPIEVGIVDTGGFQYGVDIHGSKLYCAAAWGGVTIINLIDPFDASSKETIAVDGWAMSVSVSGDELFVVQGANGVSVYDLTVQLNEPTRAYHSVSFVISGEYDGETAFLFDKQRGVLAIDFSGKKEPSLIGSWLPLLDGRRVLWVDQAAYVAGGLSGMHVYDLSSPNNPLETFWWDSAGGYARSFAFGDDNMLYLGNHMAGQRPLLGFSISDPLNPKYVNDLPDKGGGEYESILFNAAAFLGITYQKGYVYAAAEWALTVVDVRDQSKYIPVFRDYSQTPYNIDSSDNLLAAFCGNVWIYDISTPDNPVLLSSFPVYTSGQAIKFIDKKTLMVADDMSVWTVDLTDPAHPVQKTRTQTSGQVMSIYVDGAIAYMATMGGGIDVFDISDPYAPIFQENIKTYGATYDCVVSGDVMLTANSSSGVGVYMRTSKLDATADNENKQASSLKLTIPENEFTSEEYMNWQLREPSVPVTEFIVTSTEDHGAGTLREALSMNVENLYITFDTTVFSPGNPATIMLESSLPGLERDFITIDASNAGVILDGSLMSEGNGIMIYGSKCTVMGLQMYHFPSVALNSGGVYNQIGGNRGIGEGPTGQGNVISSNYTGLQINQTGSLVIGNIIGLDPTGTKAMPNSQGAHVSGYRITIGSVNPGENNIISGNTHGNLKTWGEETRIIGNYLGVDITGTKALPAADQVINMVIESGAKNCVIGGTTPEERNIISGAFIGIVFSDPNTYQCNVIGNYIGTDVTGTKALPNGTGVLYFQSGNNRVGGTEVGEANLISGNQRAVQFSSLGYTDNILIGNIIGLDANGNILRNEIGVSVEQGEIQSVIGGYTMKEANTIIANFPITLTDRGTQYCYIAGNTITDSSNAGVFVSNGSHNNYIQRNTFIRMTAPIRIDLESGNMVRGNSFDQIDQYTVFLVEGGNEDQAAPQVAIAADGILSGTTCAFGLVEVYCIDNGRVTPVGFTRADANGNFTYSDGAALAGKKIAMLVTNLDGSTSSFSQIIQMKP